MSFEFFNPWVLVGLVAAAATVAAAMRSFAGLGRIRATAHLALRMLAILALLAALSGVVLERSRVQENSHVIVVTPASPARSAAEFADAVRAAAGGNVRRRVDVRPAPETLPLDELLRLVPSWIPARTQGRVLLVGLEDEIDDASLAAARALARQDISVDVAAGLVGEPPAAAVVRAATASEPRADVPFDLTATVWKRGAAVPGAPLTIEARLSHPGAPADHGESRTLTAGPGRENVSLPVHASDIGPYLCTLELIPSGPSSPVGRAGLLPVWVSPPVRVLLVAGADTPLEPLSGVLGTGGIQLETRSAHQVSSEAPRWDNYDTIVLVNVPSAALEGTQQEALRRYVFDGGGLVMVGGPASFGCGGYYRSAVERALPVHMDPLREPPIYALMVVFDKSWSMGDVVAKAVHKVDLMREVAIAAAAPLASHDLFGLVSFDSEPHDIIELRKIADRKLVTDTISTLGAFGTTNFYRALAQAHESLKTIKATYKHVVLLSDGRSSVPNLNYQTLVEAMVKDRITVSTIGVGEDCHRQLLASIAAWGKGRAHHVATADSIPQVLLEESNRMKEILTVEVPSPVKVKTDDEILSGLDMSGCPELLGFNRVRVKESALEVLTVSHKDEPLLCVWHYGTGRAAAFASDAGPRWSADWLEKWPEGYARLWRQVVTSVSRAAPGTGSGVKLVAGASGREVRFETADAWGSPVTGLALTAEVHQWHNDERQLSKAALAEREPGLYAARLAAAPTPPCLVRVVDERGRTHAVLSVPRIDREPIEESERLRRAAELAKAGGGRVNPKPDEVFRTRPRRITRRLSIQPAMLLAALVFFLLDVIVRRYPAVVRLLRRV